MILSHLLTNVEGTGIEELAAKDDDWTSKGVMREFDQSAFLDVGWFAETGLKKYGYVFYPNQCLEESCNIHFLLHGCGTGGDYMIIDTGYGNYAVSNNLIIVAPMINNKWECHDTIGYTGEEFASKDGVQP
jgi:poly(3-hydroxybutyrate) depolymerase